MHSSLAQVKHELAAVPTPALLELLHQNVAEYRELRRRGVSAASTAFTNNSVRFLLFSDALDERGVSCSER